MTAATEIVAGPDFRPNFSTSYFVILDHPISEVFRILGTKEGHERVCRLSPLCTKFSLLKEDTIALPSQFTLDQVQARTMPSASVDGMRPETSAAQPSTRFLKRQYFQMEETISSLFGLLNTNVKLAGTLTWDEDNRIALYESVAGALLSPEIKVRKTRRFEVIEDENSSTGVEEGAGSHEQRTRVSEEIIGHCPALLQSVVQKATVEGHVVHMNLYHTLFND